MPAVAGIRKTTSPARAFKRESPLALGSLKGRFSLLNAITDALYCYSQLAGFTTVVEGVANVEMIVAFRLIEKLLPVRIVSMPSATMMLEPMQIVFINEWRNSPIMCLDI